MDILCYQAGAFLYNPSSDCVIILLLIMHSKLALNQFDPVSSSSQTLLWIFIKISKFLKWWDGGEPYRTEYIHSWITNQEINMVYYLLSYKLYCLCQYNPGLSRHASLDTVMCINREDSKIFNVGGFSSFAILLNKCLDRLNCNLETISPAFSPLHPSQR